MDISLLPKEEEALAHTLKVQDSNTLSIYSDASSHKEGHGIGVGLAAYNQGRLLFTKKDNIGPNQIVYNGELEGITTAIEVAAERAFHGQKVQVFADNQAALLRLKTPSNNPGQHWQIRCQEAAKALSQKGVLVSIH